MLMSWVFSLAYASVCAYACAYALVKTSLNLLLTEREGRTGAYWLEVVEVRTERSEVRTKTTERQYSPVRLEQARLVSSLLYSTRFSCKFSICRLSKTKQKIHSL